MTGRYVVPALLFTFVILLAVPALRRNSGRGLCAKKREAAPPRGRSGAAHSLSIASINKGQRAMRGESFPLSRTARFWDSCCCPHASGLGHLGDPQY